MQGWHRMKPTGGIGRGLGRDKFTVLQDRNVLFNQATLCSEYSDLLHKKINLKFLMRRGGPISWPPRSPDLTPLDFWMWDALKNRVFAWRSRTPGELHQQFSEKVRQGRSGNAQKALINFLRRLSVFLTKGSSRAQHASLRLQGGTLS